MRQLDKMPVLVNVAAQSAGQIGNGVNRAIVRRRQRRNNETPVDEIDEPSNNLKHLSTGLALRGAKAIDQTGDRALFRRADFNLEAPSLSHDSYCTPIGASSANPLERRSNAA